MTRKPVVLFALLVLSVSAMAAQRGRGRPDRDTIPEGSRVQYLSFQSSVLGQEIPYALYLPLSYENSTDEYPVLFFLHGANENEKRWARVD